MGLRTRTARLVVRSERREVESGPRLPLENRSVVEFCPKMGERSEEAQDKPPETLSLGRRSGDERGVSTEREDTGDQDRSLACMAGLEAEPEDKAGCPKECNEGSFSISDHGLGTQDPPED